MSTHQLVEPRFDTPAPDRTTLSLSRALPHTLPDPLPAALKLGNGQGNGP